MYAQRCTLAAVAAIGAIALGAGEAGAKKKTVVVGTITDGTWDRFDTLRKAVEGEVLELMAGEFDVTFPADKHIDGAWKFAGVRDGVDKLLADPGVDVVLAYGLLSSTVLGRMGPLPKPVIAPTALDARVQGLPNQQGKSGVKNFNYLVLPLSVGPYLDAYNQVVPVKKTAFLVAHSTAEALPELGTLVQEKAVELGIEIEFVPCGDSPDEILAVIPEGTEGVYISPLTHLGPARLKQLIDGLNARKLPTFSHFGDEDVHLGAMAGFAQATNSKRVSRRVAVNLQRILLGEDAGDLPLGFKAGDPHLVVNMATARAIDFYPSWEIISEARILHGQRTEVPRQETLESAMSTAIEVNLTLSVLRQSVAARENEVGAAMGNLLPQLDFTTQGLFIDQDRAQTSFGSQPERAGSVVGRVSQVVYSEPAWANFSVQGSLHESRVHQLEQTRLDTGLEASTAYLTLLKAKAFERILKENVRVTRANRELASVRRGVGIAQPAEIYRWDSKLATDQRDVIQAVARRNQAEIVVNRLLHRPLEEGFTTADPIESADGLMAAGDHLFAKLDNPWALRQFRTFMVEEAIATSPEIKALDKAIEAQERGLSAASRVFFLPTILLQGELSHRFWKDGAGSNPQSPIPGGPVANDTNWSVAAVLSLPLFAGGTRVYQYWQASDELTGQKLQRDEVSERIEAAVRASVHQVGASYPGIGLTRASSAAAEKTLEIVTDAYSRGAVSILDLLDAQNAARAAEESAADAAYTFLIDLMTVQRTAGSFALLDSASRQRFFGRLDEALAREDSR